MESQDVALSFYLISFANLSHPSYVSVILNIHFVVVKRVSFKKGKNIFFPTKIGTWPLFSVHKEQLCYRARLRFTNASVHLGDELKRALLMFSPFSFSRKRSYATI